MKGPSYLARAIVLLALVSQIVTLAGCRTAFAEATPALLEPGSSIDLTPQARVSIEASRPSAGTLIVLLRVTALDKSKIGDLFPNILVTYDVDPRHSDARMEEAVATVTIWQTLSGNGDEIHQVTVTEATSRKSAQWKLP